MQLLEYDAEVIDEMIKKITHTDYTFISDLYDKLRPDESKGMHESSNHCVTFMINSFRSSFYLKHHRILIWCRTPYSTYTSGVL